MTGSRSSGPAITLMSRAASRALRVIGPAVSCEWLMGTTPVRGTRPRVGFRPKQPFWCAGLTMLPLVSVPMAAAHRRAATATPLPLLLPPVSSTGLQGFTVAPPSEE